MSGKDLAKGVQGMVDIRKHANLLVVAVQEWRFVELFRSVCKETVGSTLPKLTCRIDANLNPRTYDCRVVTHGYFLRTIVARVLLGPALSGEAFQHLQRVAAIENTGLTVLRYQGGLEDDPCWRLWIYNDHAHLADV